MKKIVLGIVFLCISCSELPIFYSKSINDFTWKSMNSWYKWQEEVPNLSDTKDDNLKTYSKYLKSYTSSKDLFNSLLYRKGEVDRFSWFIEDYKKQEKSFQGIAKSFGFRPMKIELQNGVTALLVTKVSKNSPASKLGLIRGTLIIGLNGQKFIDGDYKTIVQGYYDNTAEFIIGKQDGKTVISKISLSKEEVADDAIHLTKILNVDGKKVGYFVYNGFRSSYNRAMNDVFIKFKNAGIEEFILDLRYNGGGSLYSCTYLASLIYGEGTTSDIFTKTVWNKKHSNRNTNLLFLNGMLTFDSDGNYIKGGDVELNRLKGIQKLYVLTSERTASASELIINGLRPYMDVVTVGTTTYGKNVGSITLYDSPITNYRSKKMGNITHKKAIQPITFQIFNKLNQSDYTKGFTPDIEVKEFENLEGFLAFGDENETLLKTVLNKIKGISGRPLSKTTNVIKTELLETIPFETEMYFEDNILDKFE